MSVKIGPMLLRWMAVLGCIALTSVCLYWMKLSGRGFFLFGSLAMAWACAAGSLIADAFRG